MEIFNCDAGYQRQFIPSLSEAKTRDPALRARNHFDRTASPSPDPWAHAPQDKLENNRL
jgi:hypothetical protein